MQIIFVSHKWIFFVDFLVYIESKNFKHNATPPQKKKCWVKQAGSSHSVCFAWSFIWIRFNVVDMIGRHVEINIVSVITKYYFM